jgi:hypothetical protein
VLKQAGVGLGGSAVKAQVAVGGARGLATAAVSLANQVQAKGGELVVGDIRVGRFNLL